LSPTITFISWFGWLWWCTVHTFLNIWTTKLVWIFSNISLAWFLWNTMLFTIDINLSWITSIAWTSSFTIYDNLWRNIHIWPCSISYNVNSISNWTGRSMCPTWTTISWNMLVSSPW
jgi:hypothetical protein